MKSNVLHLLNVPEECSSKNPAPHGVVRNPGKEEQGRNWCHHICRDRLALVSWTEAVFIIACFPQTKSSFVVYGTTLLPAALLVLQAKVPLGGWVMWEFWTLWGLSTWSRTWLMPLSNLSWRKFSWERQTVPTAALKCHPYSVPEHHQWLGRLCSFLCWVCWPPDPAGCRSGTSYKLLALSLPHDGHLLFIPVSILVCSMLRCGVYRRFLLMGNMASSKWYMSLVCEFLLTFYHFLCNLPTSLIIWVVLLFVCVLSTFLSLYKKLSVPASVIVSSLTRTKAAEAGGFFCLCVCRDFARVFLWTLLLNSSAVLGRKARLWYRLDAFADFYLQFAWKGGLKSIFTVQ